ncbi:hypothetical protein THAOC_07565, partial [Thalassiosira oceanica]
TVPVGPGGVQPRPGRVGSDRVDPRREAHPGERPGRPGRVPVAQRRRRADLHHDEVPIRRRGNEPSGASPAPGQDAETRHGEVVLGPRPARPRRLVRRVQIDQIHHRPGVDHTVLAAGEEHAAVARVERHARRGAVVRPPDPGQVVLVRPVPEVDVPGPAGRGDVTAVGGHGEALGRVAKGLGRADLPPRVGRRSDRRFPDEEGVVVPPHGAPRPRPALPAVSHERRGPPAARPPEVAGGDGHEGPDPERPPPDDDGRGHLTGREGVATDPVYGQMTWTGSRPVGPAGAPPEGDAPSDAEGGLGVAA